MKRNLLLVLTLIMGMEHGARGQKKLIKKLFSNQADTTRSGSFIAVPAFAYAQETGVELGAVGLYSFYTDWKDPFTRSSSVLTSVSFTTKKQSNFKGQADIWSPGNNRHFVSELRYKNFPFNFYGTGDTREQDQDLLVQRLFRVSQEVEQRLAKNYYAGVSASFENYRFRDKEPGGIFTNDGGIHDRDGGKVLFIGLSQLIDTRNTNTYTTRGSSLKISYAYAPDLFGGADFTGGLLKLELKSFRPLNRSKSLVTGVQLVHQSLVGKDAPFYLLPQLGNDQLMRGYYSGRYRDKQLLAGQIELRYRFMPRAGIVGFAGLGRVSNGHEAGLQNLKLSYGGGARYFFDIDRGLSVRVDYGFGEKKPGEARQKGLYISLAEAF